MPLDNGWFLISFPAGTWKREKQGKRENDKLNAMSGVNHRVSVVGALKQLTSISHPVARGFLDRLCVHEKFFSMWKSFEPSSFLFWQLKLKEMNMKHFLSIHDPVFRSINVSFQNFWLPQRNEIFWQLK